MVFGGVLGIWLGGVLAERYGWRAAFVALGIPGFLFALLASRLREPRRRPPPTIRATAESWYARGRVGAREALRLGAPLIWLTLAGAALSGLLDLFEGLPRGLDTAVFAACVSLGIVWTVVRLVPVAVRGTTEATEVAATAFGDFLQAAGTVLRTPTLIWMFLGGALVTFAVNGLIAWAASFLERTHGLPVAAVGRQFGVWGLAGGALGALFGGRTGDWLLSRWSGGRVVVSGAGFVLGGPVCAALLLIDELRLFVPLLFGTFFLYSWYNGPLSAVILDVVPAAVRASVLGGFVLFSHLAGDAIAPPLIGYLSDRFGLRAAMLLLPTAGAVGGLVVLIALTTVGRDMQRVKPLLRISGCGMRECRASVVARSTSHCNSAIRNPHSALGRGRRGGESRRRLRHAPPRLGGRRLQERGRRQGRGGGVRRGPGADGAGARRAHGRRGRAAGAGAGAAGRLPAEARLQRM